MELWQYDATKLASLIRTGQASAREAVDSVLGRLHKVNPAINAVVRVLEEEARATAETADAARAHGHALQPLHGVPVTTKVNVDQAGLPTDNGVVLLKDFVAQDDSPVVANLKHAGAIIVGRTNAPAFSMRIFTDNALHGRTLNPRDPSVTPGGSSGGAGAATATGIGAIAHGNDIGGSVRIPASALFHGLGATREHAANGHKGYLLGQVREKGWWYFFLVALTVKTPIPFLIFIALGSFYLGRSAWREKNWITAAPQSTMSTTAAVPRKPRTKRRYFTSSATLKFDRTSKALGRTSMAFCRSGRASLAPPCCSFNTPKKWSVSKSCGLSRSASR